MGQIHRLPADLANQIAAGEVVERPASVVKELVENALDAGAAKVQVEIDNGGLARIRVTDDGRGMDEADARLSLERHATSKITRIEDLARIATYGFRGEALPSIASVARLTLTTRARGSDSGVELFVEGGTEAAVRPAGSAVGTSVEVVDLFFNVPARRKFLKATATESAHVGEVVLLAALARPDVTFTLTRDNKLGKEYLRVSSRRERVMIALGEPRLEPCMGERGPLRIEAHLAPPERARAGAVALYLFVNGRPVKDRQLARAVAHAYGSVVEPGRYPVGVVYLELPPEMVDVNVHPQKSEVRFADARAVFDAVSKELHGELARAFGLPAMAAQGRWQAWNTRGGSTAVTATMPTSSVTPTAPLQEWGFAAAEPLPLREPRHDPELFARANFYGNLRFLAQSRATFLVCEGPDGLYVLDQHAAAERVNFERLRKAFRARGVASQRLLLPEVVELAPAEVAALEEHADDVLALGIEARAVGPTAVAVHSVPRLLGRASPERLVRDLVAELTRAAKRPFSDAADLVLATMACHGSVRAGDVLGAEEASALLRDLDTVDFAGHCPHGRPVVTRLGFDELERRVGR